MKRIPPQLQTALDELTTAHLILQATLNHALHSALHSTYTAAIKRILAFNDQTIKSTGNLIEALNRQASRTKH